jgi:hypothetical protein
MMTSRSRTITLGIAALLTLVSLAACGSGGNKAHATGSTTATGDNASASTEVVAKVGAVPITKAQVSHWMTALAGSVYHNVSHELTLPEGLVSDPPNYTRCVARLEAAAAASPLGHARETGPELLAKCRELNGALQVEATNFLIKAQQTTALAAEAGVVVSPAEVQASFKQTRVTNYPTEADLHRYLASRNQAVADLLLEIKLELLSTRLSRKAAALGGLAAFKHILETNHQRLVERTSCSPGYVVESCSQYRGGSTYPGRTPSALLEQVSAVVTDKCVDLAGCGKQVGE